MAIIDFHKLFSTDAKCRELLERLRWPNGPQCPRCKTQQVVRRSEKLLCCNDCDYEFSVTVGTIFHDSHLPLFKWFIATYVMCEFRKGMNVNKLRSILGGQKKWNYQTAWYLWHRISKAMATAYKPAFDGTLELNETSTTGKERRRGQHAKLENKEVVLAICSRDGELRFFKERDLKAGALAKYVNGNVSQSVAILVTGGSEAHPFAFTMAEQGAKKNERVRHFMKEYLRLEDGTMIGMRKDGAAFSLLKLARAVTWDRIRAKHLQAYVEQMKYRLSRRKPHDLFLDTLRQMITADPMTLKDALVSYGRIPGS